MARHNELGRWGEDIAADYLISKGYTIIERDWHSGHRDIDIIARQGEWLVFVEVKTRSSEWFRQAVEAVDYKKVRNLRLAINHYLHYRRYDGQFRCDVITVIGTMGSKPQIDHIEDIYLM